jgi:hypothetical protein
MFGPGAELVSHLNWNSLTNYALTIADASPTPTPEFCEKHGWHLITTEQAWELGLESIGIGAIAFAATLWMLDMLRLLWGFGLDRIRDISRAVQGR